jgi:hypothetical protein
VLTGAKTVMKSLLVEMAEKVRQENMKILWGSSLPRKNLPEADRTSLRAPRTNADSAFHPVDKGKAMRYLRPWTTIRRFNLQTKNPTLATINVFLIWQSFTILTPLSLPVYVDFHSGLKIFSLLNFELICNRIFLWYLGKWSKTCCSCS